MERSITRLPASIFEKLADNVEDPKILKNEILSKLALRNITTLGPFLELAPLSLMVALDPLLTFCACITFVDRVREYHSAKGVHALDLLHRTVDLNSWSVFSQSEKLFSQGSSSGRETTPPMRHIPCGMEGLDFALKGGLRVGTITEIVGRAGVGKTQLAMQLAVQAGLELGQGSVYIDTEQKLSLRRMKEMLSVAKQKQSGSQKADDDDFYASQRSSHRNISIFESENLSSVDNNRGPSTQDVLSNVIIHEPKSTEQMLEVLRTLENDIVLHNQNAESKDYCDKTFSQDGPAVKMHPIRLLIIDSIAAPTRRDFGHESGAQRVAMLFKAAQILKRIADQLQIAVVVINQVGINQGAQNLISDEGSDFVAVTAALGNSWQHCVSTRLLLEHERDPHRQGNAVDAVHEANVRESQDISIRPAWMNTRGQVRTATIVKSNVCGNSTVSYEVTAAGLCEL